MRKLTEWDCKEVERLQAENMKAFGCIKKRDGKDVPCYWVNDKGFPSRCNMPPASIFLMRRCGLSWRNQDG
jgi:hypothetical protein